MSFQCLAVMFHHPPRTIPDSQGKVDGKARNRLLLQENHVSSSQFVPSGVRKLCKQINNSKNLFEENSRAKWVDGIVDGEKKCDKNTPPPFFAL